MPWRAGHPTEGPKDEHAEGALEDLESPVVGSLGYSCRQSTALDVEGLQLVPGRGLMGSVVTAEVPTTLPKESRNRALGAELGQLPSACECGGEEHSPLLPQNPLHPF